MITIVADATSYLVDHLTVFLIVAALCVTFLLFAWMLILFLLGWHRYPDE
jgi:hypothetical protein